MYIGNSVGDWEYTDGTDYDYVIGWGPIPSGGGGFGECVSYQQSSDYFTGFYYGYCTNTYTICMQL